jgi:hypothetical protein
VHVGATCHAGKKTKWIRKIGYILCSAAVAPAAMKLDASQILQAATQIHG